MKTTLATICSLTVAALLMATPAQAQNAKKIATILDSAPPKVAAPTKKDKTAEPKKQQPLFYLRDRSKIAGMPKIDALVVKTRYGLLHIPTKELVNVRLVPRLDPKIEENVAAQIAKLGNDDFDVREGAMDAIREVGPKALTLLRAARKSENEEIANRTEILVEELEEQAKKEDSKLGSESVSKLKGTDDEIVTTRMTIRGMVQMKKVIIGSRYGDLTVDVADLEAIAFGKTQPTAGKVDVLPKYQPRGNWLDTKIMVEAGQRFRVEATGTMSVSNYGVSCGPTGTTQWSSGNSFNNYPMLSLVGKVGKKGKPFLVGSNYKGKGKKPGRLYLSIVPFSYNVGGAVGKYTAKIRVLGVD
ncbi:MAG: hypothetical protein AAF517_21090 [Planctomycetota bacterium]